MGVFHVSKKLFINSHSGEYEVCFRDSFSLLETFDESLLDSSHFLIDSKVAEIYAKQLTPVLSCENTLIIQATENNKSLTEFPDYVEHLVAHGVRRDHRLVAIGGGIIQDITCFLAATMLRGIDWWFYPTTLLAQADSCIGSKSSVNCNSIKNILGTFTPPKRVMICAEFLSTLSLAEIKSGVGEMLKVHAIDGPNTFAKIQAQYDSLFNNNEVMLHFIRRSLEIKKHIIEQDEFDKNVRNVMNYGHTFGHAIESATQYQIPHGVAVTMGMDMANFLASEVQLCRTEYFDNMHETLRINFSEFAKQEIPLDAFITAIAKDKKNKGKNQLGLILPDRTGMLKKTFLENNELFKHSCQKYFNEVITSA